MNKILFAASLLLASTIGINAASPSYDNFSSGDFQRIVNNLKLRPVLTNQVYATNLIGTVPGSDPNALTNDQSTAVNFANSITATEITSSGSISAVSGITSSAGGITNLSATQPFSGNAGALTNVPAASLNGTASINTTGNAATATTTTNSLQLGSALNITLPPFNAVGDGVTTNNTANVQITALCATSTVPPVFFVPAGTYIFTNIDAGYGATFMGEGDTRSTIKFLSGITGTGDQYNGNFLLKARYGSLQIYDLTFDGQHSGNLAAAQSGTTNVFPVPHRSGIFIGSNSNSTSRVMRNTFKGFNGKAIFFRGSDNAGTALNNLCIIADNTFTNNYDGVQTDSGDTADYAQVVLNRFVRNYHGGHVRGGNHIWANNQFIANYIEFYGSAADMHSTIEGNIINHGTLASFFFEGCNVASQISGNTIRGGGDIYFVNSSNMVFRGNSMNFAAIISDANSSGNLFENNTYSTIPATSGAGLVVQRQNKLDGGRVYPDEWEHITSMELNFSGTGIAHSNPNSTSDTPHFFADNWQQTDASSSAVYMGLSIEPDVTEVKLRYSVMIRGGADAWTDTWTTYYNNDAARLGGVNYTTNLVFVSNVPREIEMTIPMPATNAWKQLNLIAAVGTNTTPRIWIHGLRMVKYRN